MNHHRAARRAALILSWSGVALLGCLLLVTLAGCGSGKAAAEASAHPSAAAAGSSAASAASVYATSTAGATARTEAQQIANACAHVLGPQGWNAIAPGVPGAPAARRAFWECEKIPRAEVFAAGVCLARAYTSTPPKGPTGSPAETTRQAWLTDKTGRCIAAAKGITLQTGPPATPGSTP